jgi:outer membrane protein assembly factor BamB
MARSYGFAAAVYGVLFAGLAMAGGEGPPAAPMPREVPEVPPDKDISAEVKDWNSAKFAGPPTKFREGHVTARKLDAKAIAKTPVGFTVQLPSGAPIPTPTVYRGKVYVSGGFHSKEFYCFDAATGALAWAIDLDDDGPTAAVCDDGVTVFNTESCTLFAVDSDTGKHLWSLWLGDPLTSTPTIANGVVFTSYPAAGGGGQLEQNPPINNAKPAEKPQGNAIPPAPPAANAPPANPGNGKAAPPCSHVLVALELKTGKILWQRWLDSDVMSAPVAVDKELYCTSFGGVVYKFAQKDGEVLSAVRTRATSAPVIAGGEVYFSRRLDKDGAACPQEAQATVSRVDNKPVAATEPKEAVYLDQKVQGRTAQGEAALKLDASNGFGGGAPAQANPTAAWHNVGYGNVSSMQAFQGSRVLHMDGRNFSTMGDRVMCNDPKTGKELWSYKLEGDLKKDGGFLGAPPAAAGGHLVMTTLKGDVLRMDAAGKVVKTWETKSPTRFQAAVEGGRIYIGTQDGKLIMIDTGDKTLTGWSCWGGNPQHTGVGTAK